VPTDTFQALFPDCGERMMVDVVVRGAPNWVWSNRSELFQGAQGAGLAFYLWRKAGRPKVGVRFKVVCRSPRPSWARPPCRCSPGPARSGLRWRAWPNTFLGAHARTDPLPSSNAFTICACQPRLSASLSHLQSVPRPLPAPLHHSSRLASRHAQVSRRLRGAARAAKHVDESGCAKKKKNARHRYTKIPERKRRGWRGPAPKVAPIRAVGGKWTQEPRRSPTPVARRGSSA
jgi:hypothetical protein